AITSFAAPVLAAGFGWRSAVRMYIVLVFIFALLNLIFGDRREPRVQTSFTRQWKEIYRETRMWFLSLFYFITFGSFVAFTVYLPNFLVEHFHLEPVDAGLRTAGFIVLATAMRPLGGWLADKFDAFVILVYVFSGITLAGALLAFSP